MSINWVMLNDTDGFVRLPDELIIRVSPRRTSFSLQDTTTKQGLHIQSSHGTAYLTNQRIVYLPASPTPNFHSFSAPLLNLYDTHIAAPFFGPNVWTAALKPVPGGNLIPAPTTTTTSTSSSSSSTTRSPPPLLTLKLTFKDGGAYDFHTDYETIKDRLLQLLEESPSASSSSAAAAALPGAGLNYAAVNLDPLPAYEESSPDDPTNLSLRVLELPYTQRAWPAGGVNVATAAGGGGDGGGETRNETTGSREQAPAPAYDDSGAVTSMPVQSPPYVEVAPQVQTERERGEENGYFDNVQARPGGEGEQGSPVEPPPGYEDSQREAESAGAR